jgi:hypothetical protein
MDTRHLRGVSLGNKEPAPTHSWAALAYFSGEVVRGADDFSVARPFYEIEEPASAFDCFFSPFAFFCNLHRELQCILSFRIHLSGSFQTDPLPTRNVGTGLSVTASGLSLTATNTSSACASSSCTVYGYQVSNAGGTVTANIGTITARSITVTAATNTKTYDGTTSAAATPMITSGSLAGGDSVSWTESYASKNAGTGLTLTPTGTVSDGNGGNNYAVTFVTNTTGAINQAPLTITADNKSRVYNTANPLLTASYTGQVDGDTSSVVTGLILSTTATMMSPVGTYPITASGGTAANYVISYVNGVLTVTAVPGPSPTPAQQKSIVQNTLQTMNPGPHILFGEGPASVDTLGVGAGIVPLAGTGTTSADSLTIASLSEGQAAENTNLFANGVLDGIQQLPPPPEPLQFEASSLPSHHRSQIGSRSPPH